MIYTYQKDEPDSLTKMRFHHEIALVSYCSQIRWLWLKPQLYYLLTVIMASYSITQHLCISVLICRTLNIFFHKVVVKIREGKEKRKQSASQDLHIAVAQ